MSRLEFLLRQWWMQREELRRRVRENRVGDAWRWEPLVKVLTFLLSCYGRPADAAEPQFRGRRTFVTAAALFLVLFVMAAIAIQATGGQILSWLDQRFTQYGPATDPANGFVLLDTIAFTRVQWLWLWLVVPAAYWLADRWSRDLVAWKRRVARLCVATAVILAAPCAAGVRLLLPGNALTVLFVVDQSASVPGAARDQILADLDAVIRTQRKAGDQVGVLTFGRDAAVEMMPTGQFGSAIHWPESAVDRNSSDIAAAIDRAASIFTPDAAKRIVLVSDGNQNRGDALRAARAAAAKGIGIDVIPISYRHERETLIDDLTIDSDVRVNQPAECIISLRATTAASGTVRLIQRSAQASSLVTEHPVHLRRGENHLRLTRTFNTPGVHSVEAIFLPESTEQDQVYGNNHVQTTFFVGDGPRVLLIEGGAGEHDTLVANLERENIHVVRASPEQVPNNLAELAQYDCVLLGNVVVTNVPDEFGAGRQPGPRLSQAQMESLRRTTHDLGTGLVMIAGPASVGADGLAGTPIEQALPVALPAYQPAAAVIILDKLNDPQWPLIERQILKDSLKSLVRGDRAGCIQGRRGWLFPLHLVDEPNVLYSVVDRMSDSLKIPAYDPVLYEALDALAQSQASSRHIIVITAGTASAPSAELLRRLVEAKITVSVMVEGASNDALRQRDLVNLARRTGGRFYALSNVMALPNTIGKELRYSRKPMVPEREGAWTAELSGHNELLDAPWDTALPAVSSFAIAVPKEEASVAVSIKATHPDEPRPLLANWQYGLGRAAAFTSDAGQKWATAWKDWPGYCEFWVRVVRWCLRNAPPSSVNVIAQRQAQRVVLRVIAPHEQDSFAKVIELECRSVRANSPTEPLRLIETEPGQFEGAISDPSDPGVYLVAVSGLEADSKRRFVKLVSATVPYSVEYRDLVSQPALLRELAAETPAGGRPGRVVTPEEAPEASNRLAGSDFFRHDLAQPNRALALGPWLLLISGCLVVAMLACQSREPPPRRESLQYEEILRYETVK